MGKIISGIVSAAMGVGVIFGYVATVTQAEPPVPTRVVEYRVPGISCPEEDTCRAALDYRHGGWYARVSK